MTLRCAESRLQFTPIVHNSKCANPSNKSRRLTIDPNNNADVFRRTRSIFYLRFGSNAFWEVLRLPIFVRSPPATTPLPDLLEA